MCDCVTVAVGVCLSVCLCRARLVVCDRDLRCAFFAARGSRPRRLKPLKSIHSIRSLAFGRRSSGAEGGRKSNKQQLTGRSCRRMFGWTVTKQTSQTSSERSRISRGILNQFCENWIPARYNNLSSLALCPPTSLPAASTLSILCIILILL